MDDCTKRVDVLKLISLGDDLIGVLKNKKDNDNLVQSLDGVRALRSSCEVEFHEVQNSLQDYQERINTCKQKVDMTKSEIVPDKDLERLQDDLEKELQKERLLRQELRTVSDELVDLERQRISVEERKSVMKRRDKDELRAQDMLSMCASVTNIIPDLVDQTRISGYIVDRDKKKFEKFEFEPTSSSFEMCNRLWKMEL